MFNIIFPIIIFVSLAIIVFIVGKHLPEFVDIKKEGKGQFKKSEYFKEITIKFLIIIKNFLLWLVEKIIKGIKNFLNLIQSWISDNKKKKNQEKPSEESKKTDLDERDNFLKKIARKEEFEEKTPEKEILIEKKPKKNFFIEFKNDLKERILEKKRQKINQVFEETDDYNEDNNQFSDGIVKIHEKIREEKAQKREGLINEVVEIKKTKTEKMSIDEEIGVDRNILEKKLINKIGQNPRDKEVYRQLGELYLKMKNYCDAEGCYKQILKIAVRDIDAKRKLDRISLLRRSQRK